MTRTPLVPQLVLPLSLVGLACVADGESPSILWNGDSTETKAGDGDGDGEGSGDDNGAGDSDGDGDDDDSGTPPGNGAGDDNGAGDGDGDGNDDGNAEGDGDGDGDGGPGGAVPMSGTPTEENLRVAFLGDQGTTSDSSAVLDLVSTEGAAFLVIAGDFDYGSNPNAWESQTNDSLGPDYPIFAVAGNHDKDAFDGNDGYQAKITARTQNAIDNGATCTGELGRNSTCSYKGLFLAMSGVDVFEGHAESGDYLRSELAKSDALWSVCVWHKNMTDMQAGDKPDEAGWEVYQACQDEGGIIMTGHEHSYARTLTLTDIGNAAGGHGAEGEPGQMVVNPGSTYVSVVGLGGRNARAYEAALHENDTWWASLYTTNLHMKNMEVVDGSEAKAGVLFIDFYVDGDPSKAHAYFKNIDGEIIDEYDIVRQ
jgi:hypothetical protein